MSNTLSLESLYGDKFSTGSTGSKKAAAVAFAKNGLMPVFFESCEEASVYAMEAANQYNEGVSYSRLVDYSIESMVINATLVKKANSRAKRLGVESAVLSLEDAESFKHGLKKVVTAIVAALQRFIAALANLIKTIAAWVGGQLAKTQQKVFDDYVKTKAATTVKVDSNPKINIVQSGQKANIKGIEKLFSKINDACLGISSAAEKSTNSNTDAVTAILAKFSFPTQVNSYITTALKQGKSPSSQAVANILSYGNAKTHVQSVPINNFTPDIDGLITEYGTAQALEAAKTKMVEARKASAAMNKAMNWVKEMDKRVGDTKFGKGGMKSLIFVRNIHQFNVGMILASYSIFLKKRSVAYKIAKIRLSAVKTNEKNIKNKKNTDTSF